MARNRRDNRRGETSGFARSAREIVAASEAYGEVRLLYMWRAMQKTDNDELSSRGRDQLLKRPWKILCPVRGGAHGN